MSDAPPVVRWSPPPAPGLVFMLSGWAGLYVMPSGGKYEYPNGGGPTFTPKEK